MEMDKVLCWGTHRAGVWFSGADVAKATLVEGFRNVDPEAAWINQEICVDVVDYKVDVRIKWRVDSELGCS